MSVVLLLIVGLPLGSLLIAGVHFMLNRRRKEFDQDRKSYILTFPSDLREDSVAAWLRATSRTVRRGQSIVFETIATEERIVHRLRVPWQHAEDITAQLRALVPGIAAAEDDKPLRFNWTKAVEVGESNKDRPLSIFSAVTLSQSILANFHPLKEGEALLMQWVIAPAPREPLPSNRSKSSEFKLLGVTMSNDINSDELKERREKLGEPNVMAVLRIAAKANTDPRAKSLIGRVRSSLKAVESPHNYWTERTVRDAVERTRTARSMTLWPAQLSITELTGLIGWLGGDAVPGMPSGRSKYLPASVNVPKVGRIFGDANMPGNERPVAVSVVESNKHWHIVGRTGSGKSTLMTNLAAQDIAAGRGLVLIDPKYDLFASVLETVPASRMNDVVIFDVADTARPVGFNLLDQGDSKITASEIESLFSHIYKMDGAVRLPEVLYHALITLMDTKAEGGPFTFIDMVPLLWPESNADSRFARAVVDGLEDRTIREWWKTHNKMSRTERDKYLASLRSRIWQFNSRPELRNIIGQSEASIDMRDIVENRKILLVNLHGLSPESSSLIGSSIVNNLKHAVKAGLSSQDNPVSLYLDEFHNFVKASVAFDQMLAEMRSFGLSMHLAHQGLDQLAGNRALEDAVMNNAVNKIVFQRGSKDSRAFASEFGAPVTDDDLKKLTQYEFIARVSTEKGISPPMTGFTRPPIKPEYQGRFVRDASRIKYGKSAYEVEAEIEARRRIGVGGDDSAPDIGDEEYDG